MSKDLKITLQLDRKQQAQVEAEARADSAKTAKQVISDADVAEKEKVKKAKESAAARAASEKQLQADIAKAKKEADAEFSKIMRQSDAEARQVTAERLKAERQAAQEAIRLQKQKAAEAKKALEEQKRAQEKLTAAQGDGVKSLVQMTAAMVGLQSGQAVIRSIGSEYQRSAEYITSMAKDFIVLQKTMQSVAAITGNKNSNAFTVSEATAGAAANLVPEQWTSFRDSFMAKASNYVGDKKSARLNDTESAKFQASMAEYAVDHGVPLGEMADFAGGLLAQEKGPTTAAAMTSKAGKVFATLEASSKKVSGLLPGMTRIMAQGFTAEEAAPKLAMMPEIAPDEESTHLLRAINEIRQVANEGKGDQFGMEKGMSPNQKLEAVVGNLHKRSQKNGKIDDEKLDSLLMQLTPETITQNTLRGLVNKGPEGMNQWKAILAGTPDNIVQTDIASARQTDAGKVRSAEAQQALSRVKRGAEFASAEPEFMKARGRLNDSHRLDEIGIPENLARQAAGLATGVSVEQQLVNQYALSDVRQRALAAGVNEPGLQTASRSGNDAILTQQLEVNKEIVRLLKLISEKEGLPGAKIPAPIPGRPANPALRVP